MQKAKLTILPLMLPIMKSESEYRYHRPLFDKYNLQCTWQCVCTLIAYGWRQNEVNKDVLQEREASGVIDVLTVFWRPLSALPENTRTGKWNYLFIYFPGDISLFLLLSSTHNVNSKLLYTNQTQGLRFINKNNYSPK